MKEKEKQNKSPFHIHFRSRSLWVCMYVCLFTFTFLSLSLSWHTHRLTLTHIAHTHRLFPLLPMLGSKSSKKEYSRCAVGARGIETNKERGEKRRGERERERREEERRRNTNKTQYTHKRRIPLSLEIHIYTTCHNDGETSVCARWK